jgi:hypothetical protein
LYPLVLLTALVTAFGVAPVPCAADDEGRPLLRAVRVASAPLLDGNVLDDAV